MARIGAYYRALLRRFGPQRWWPARTPFEVMVGAVLTQNTAWTNVEKAIRNLRRVRLLHPRRLARADLRTIARAVRPSGYFNVKARRLRTFVRWFVERYGADVRRMRRVPLPRLRSELLAVNGVGPETADSILLYALDRPTFVVDAYTHRVLTRHGLVPEATGYDGMKAYFEERLAPDAARFNEFHALLVAVGKEFCAPTPRCERCPLRRFLP